MLGHSISEILKANGNNVVKVQIINDRGIHICKSMVAWKKFGLGEDPQSSNIKGDHLVGKYYVKFNTVYSEQVNDLVKKGFSLDQAEKQAPIFLEAQNMLLKWESGDKEIIDLWKKMNNWVYDGFDQTYSRLNVSFDKNYYESNTFLLGKTSSFKRLDLKAIPKPADTGPIGGNLSHEFIILAETGESKIFTDKRIFEVDTKDTKLVRYDLELVGAEINKLSISFYYPLYL